jgi:catechol 2,3-dioxygenase-like lactoylglutathione lyase family enzyme
VVNARLNNKREIPMRASAWFLGGLVVGAVLVQTSVAQDRARRGLNHIGIGTKNYDAALAFYRDTLGAKEAFTIRNPDGTPRITYLQVSRDTFIELLPVAADQRAGILHVGIETEDLAASVANLRARGITIPEPTVGVSKAQVARITDVDGVNIEVMQMGADSMQRQAIDAWR